MGPAQGPQAAKTNAIEEGVRTAAAVLADPTSLASLGDAVGRSAPGTFEVTVKDDGCDAAKAEAVAKEIVAENFDLVLGHPCPKAALAAAKVYGAAGVTFIATETRHPDLTAKRAGPSIFRLCGRDDAQGLDAARSLLEGRRFKTIAVVHDRTLYAKTIAEQAEAALKAAKQEVVTATIIAGDKDYTKLIAKIKDAGAVFFAGFPMEAGFILQQLRAAGSTAVFLATETVATAEFTSTFPDLAKDVIALVPVSNLPFEPDRVTAVSATTAVRVYNRARVATMGPFRDKAMERAAINAVIASLPAVKFDGLLFVDRLTIVPLHEIAFDAAGNASLPSFALSRWREGKWQNAGGPLPQ